MDIPSVSRPVVFSHAVYWTEARNGVSLAGGGSWGGVWGSQLQHSHMHTHTQSFENKQSLKATQQGGFTFPGVRTHFHLRRRQRDTECDGRQIEDVNEVEKRSHE